MDSEIPVKAFWYSQWMNATFKELNEQINLVEYQPPDHPWAVITPWNHFVLPLNWEVVGH